jgi:hypothetical protein
MGRKPEKYLYLTLGIRRGSVLHLHLLEDSEEHDIQLPTLVKTRLGDYYEGKTRGGGTALVERQEVVSPIAEEVDLIENIDAASVEWPK